QVRTREAHHRGACDLRQGTPVGEISVGEGRVPVKAVEDGIILVPMVLATELNAYGRYAGKVLESGVVGPVPHGFDQEIAALAKVGALLRVFRLGNARQMRTLKD